MSKIIVGLTQRTPMRHVPLAALGHALRRAQILQPLTEVPIPIKTLQHTVPNKLLESLVLILAGGRATAQIDLLLRPNQALAQAWGQGQFADQSTVSDMFDAMTEASIEGLQTAFAQLWQTHSQTKQHDFRRGDLILDGDLTGLPASKHADGSQKGYFAGKKTDMVANSRG